MIIDNDECTGCGLCEQICPKNAIRLQKNDEGFLYPVIDKVKCINCNLCNRLCPQTHSIRLNEPNKVFGSKLKSESLRKRSSSGGLATALSSYIIENNGIVYGAVFDKDFKVVHKRCSNTHDIADLAGTKYVQSDLNNCFFKIANDLKNSRLVLFIGTPCQVSGLLRFIEFKKIDSTKLYTVDLICHGVPSPEIFKKYIVWLRDIYGDFNNYQFRDKSISWHGTNISIATGDKKIINTRELRTYSDLYFSGFITRPSCHNCHYTNKCRVSDITLGDFWGIDKIDKNFADETGVSIVFINSKKGNYIFSKISEVLLFKEFDINQCWQPQLCEPPKKNRNRTVFWKDYKKRNAVFVLKKWSYFNFTRRCLAKIKNKMIICIKKLNGENQHV